jgi:hypothetical protein
MRDHSGVSVDREASRQRSSSRVPGTDSDRKGFLGGGCYLSFSLNGTHAARFDVGETAQFHVGPGEILMRSGPMRSRSRKQIPARPLPFWVRVTATAPDGAALGRGQVCETLRGNTKHHREVSPSTIGALWVWKGRQRAAS